MRLPVENYEFPRDWKVSPVSDVADFSRGVSWGKAEEAAEGEGLLVISIPNIKDGLIDYDSKFNHYLAKEVTASKRLNIGDIVFVGSSGSIHNVGRNARVASLPKGSVAFASFTFKAAPKLKAIDGEFFYYLVNSGLVPFPSFCTRAADGKFNFQLRDFANRLTIPLPPLPEQKKIAHILSTVQRAIEAQERIIETTTELKKALMHKLFTEGLRREPQKQTESGLVPESWEVVPLSECAVVQTGIAKGRQVNVEEAVEVPYLRVANVQDGYLDLSEMKTITIRKNEQQRFALQDGDVVLTEGGDFDKLGRGFIWHGQIENCVHQNHVFAVRPDKMQISSEFFAYLSQSPYGKSYFLSVAHKTTNLACINTTKLKAFPVLLPPQDQQADIVVACSSIDGKIRNATNKKNHLQDLFRALLHELMTAKTRVHKLEITA